MPRSHLYFSLSESAGLVSTQILVFRIWLEAGAKKIIFMKKLINLHMLFGIFIMVLSRKKKFKIKFLMKT
jgi:hypothetical protein